MSHLAVGDRVRIWGAFFHAVNSRLGTITHLRPTTGRTEAKLTYYVKVDSVTMPMYFRDSELELLSAVDLLAEVITLGTTHE